MKIKVYKFRKAIIEEHRNKGYIIQEGSCLAREEKSSIPVQAKEVRRKLKEDGYVDDDWIMLRDSFLITNAESTICSVICGYSVAPRLKEI